MKNFPLSPVVAACIGFAFAIGLLVGRLTAPKPKLLASSCNRLEDIVNHEAEYQAIQKQLKLSYYHELLAQPKTTPIEDAIDLELESMPAPKTVEVERPSTEKMAGALVKVLGNEAPSQLKDAKSTFAIQLAALPSRASADAMLSKLNSKGVSAHIVTADIPGKGTVYRVRILGFKSRQEAGEFKQTHQLDGIILLHE